MCLFYVYKHDIGIIPSVGQRYLKNNALRYSKAIKTVIDLRLHDELHKYNTKRTALRAYLLESRYDRWSLIRRPTAVSIA